MFEKDNKLPEDIFANTEKPVANSPSIPAPVNNPLYSPQPEPVYSASGGSGRRLLFIFGGGVLVLIVLGIGAFLVMTLSAKRVADIPDDVPQKIVEDEEQAPEETDEQNKVVSPVAPLPKVTIVDSDGDGLTNAEELEAGTSATLADSDADGLGDREEVKVYGTDPRRKDTDGDTFFDGQEVSQGYNPNGPGKLLQIPD